MTRPRTVFAFLATFVALLHLVPMVNMVAEGLPIPTFVVVDALSLVAFGLGAVVLGRRLQTGKLSELDVLVPAYLTFSLASYLLYFSPGHPAVALQYLYGVHHLVMPMSLYFVVQALDDAWRLRLTRHLVAWNLVAIVLGGVLFFWRPDFYVGYLLEHYQTSAEDELIFFRMGSYLGSISMGVIAASTIALLRATPLRPWMQYVLAGVLFMGALLSGQRGGMVAAAGGLAFLLVTERSASRRVTMAALTAGLGAAAILYMESRIPGTLAYLAHRVVSAGDALAERSGSYQEGLRYLADYPLGLGLGAASPAGATGLNIRTEVSDANYLRVLADLGFVGLALFLLVLVRAAVRALRDRRRTAWGAAVGLICVVALGSNVFDTYYLSHMLWLLVGMLGDPPPDRPDPPVHEPARPVLEAVG